MYMEILDVIPLWCFPPLLLVVCILTLDVGYRLGNWRHARAADEKEAPVASMVGSVLGLLAFMLAFTFSMGATRFDTRRQAVLQEANAIGTTYLRSRLLPKPEGDEIATLLVRYTELRTRKLTSESISDLLVESQRLQDEMWAKAVGAAEKTPGSITTGLFLESLNQTIDLHSERVFFGLYSRIPIVIWMMLFGLVVLGMISVGYQSGIAATRRSPAMFVLIFAFSCVLYLIIDLDRAHEGLVQVSQRAIVELYETMQMTKR
jgi:hypothetical protein